MTRWQPLDLWRLPIVAVLLVVARVLLEGQTLRAVILVGLGLLSLLVSVGMLAEMGRRWLWGQRTGARPQTNGPSKTG